MAKKIQMMIALTAFLAIGAILSGSAMAEATATPTSTVTVTVEQTNEKHASAGTFIKFKVLSYVKAEGLTKEEIANAEECRMIGAGTDVPVYTNSGIGVTTGAFFEFEDRDREKACKINGQWYLVRCKNKVWFYVRPNIFHGQVLLVKTRAFKKIRIHIPLHVKVPSPCGGSPAESVAKIDQWVRYKAIVKAKGDVKIRISGKIIDRVKAHVRAGSTCKTTTTTTTTEKEKPPCSTCNPKTPPVVTNLETINDVEVNGHRTICAEFFAPAGENLNDLTIKFKATYGVFAGNLQFKGGPKVCDTYYAPSEVPAGGQEIYSAFARDNITGLTAESEVRSFPIKPETKF